MYGAQLFPAITQFIVLVYVRASVTRAPFFFLVRFAVWAIYRRKPINPVRGPTELAEPVVPFFSWPVWLKRGILINYSVIQYLFFFFFITTSYPSPSVPRTHLPVKTEDYFTGPSAAGNIVEIVTVIPDARASANPVAVVAFFFTRRFGQHHGHGNND